MKDFAAIDFETANRNPASVCSVGLVVVRDGLVRDSFYSLIKPVPNYYSYWNTRVHGLTYSDTSDAPEFPEVWEKVVPIIEELPLVAHNAVFDQGCLKAVFAWYDLAYPRYDFRCTCRAARKVFPFLLNHQLQTVSAHCGFDLVHHHNALADAEACAAIALRVF
ncbi:MAG: 3'-5' exonuclease [Bacteroidales bacterium]|nr:3'-5' exonuclease [Bacteroidales bacterium]